MWVVFCSSFHRFARCTSGDAEVFRSTWPGEESFWHTLTGGGNDDDRSGALARSKIKTRIFRARMYERMLSETCACSTYMCVRVYVHSHCAVQARLERCTINITIERTHPISEWAVKHVRMRSDCDLFNDSSNSAISLCVRMHITDVVDSISSSERK